MTALRYKFTQTDGLKKYLLDTCDKVLVEDSPYDPALAILPWTTQFFNSGDAAGGNFGF